MRLLSLNQDILMIYYSSLVGEKTVRITLPPWVIASKGFNSDHSRGILKVINDNIRQTLITGKCVLGLRIHKTVEIVRDMRS